MTVFLNGEFMPIEEAKVPVLDRGFIFGDGVYEVVPVYSKVPFRLEEHLARLERSLAAVGIRNPYTREQWRGFVAGIVERQAFEDQGVYFQVTRGVAKRDHAFPKQAEPTVFMMSNPLVAPPAALVEKGASAISARDNRWLRCDIKSISLIGNVLLRQLSAEADAVETILFRDGKLTEASSSNVFVIKSGVIQSPPKNELILPGITYDVVVELAHAHSLPFEFPRRSAKPKCAAPTSYGSPLRRRKCLPSCSSTVKRSATANRARCSGACSSITRISSGR